MINPGSHQHDRTHGPATFQPTVPPRHYEPVHSGRHDRCPDLTPECRRERPLQTGDRSRSGSNHAPDGLPGPYATRRMCPAHPCPYTSWQVRAHPAPAGRAERPGLPFRRLRPLSGSLARPAPPPAPIVQWTGHQAFNQKTPVQFRLGVPTGMGRRPWVTQLSLGFQDPESPFVHSDPDSIVQWLKTPRCLREDAGSIPAGIATPRVAAGNFRADRPRFFHTSSPMGANGRKPHADTSARAPGSIPGMEVARSVT